MDSCISIRQRYNFESNSQLSMFIIELGLAVFQYVKDTILKAIHNEYVFHLAAYLAVFQYVKDTILKAIHSIS